MGKKSSQTALLIRTSRRAKGITQKFLGKKLGYKSGQYLSNIERGMCHLTLEKAVQTCTLLDIKPAKMMEALFRDQRQVIKSVFRKD